MTLEFLGTLAAIVLGLANFSYIVITNKGKDVWKLSDRLTKLDQSRIEFRESIFKHVETKCDESVNQFGEAVRAQAEHTRLLELELYKNFVRIDTFKDSMSALTVNMGERLTRIEKRFDTIEDLIRHNPKS